MSMLTGLVQVAGRKQWLGSIDAFGPRSPESRPFADTSPSTLPTLPTLTPPDDRATDLDYGQAMRAHVALTTRLRAHLDDPFCCDLADAHRLCHRNSGRLGRWLHGDGLTRYGHLPTYRQLVLAHRSLHLAAADVLGLNRAGRTTAARLQLEHGLYARYADRVSDLITQFYLDRDGRAAVFMSTAPDPFEPMSATAASA